MKVEEDIVIRIWRGNRKIVHCIFIRKVVLLSQRGTVRIHLMKVRQNIQRKRKKD